MIDEMSYLGKIGDSYLFAENILGIGLTDLSTLKMTDRLTGGVRELAYDPKIWVGNPTRDELDKVVQIIESEIYKSNSAKVLNYKRWVLNYSLVMLCSIFDEYENDLLKSVIEANPLLCLWETKEEIISSFEHENSQLKRIKVFKNRLKLSENDLFDFKGFKPEVQIKFSGMNTDKLIEIYKKRDKSAHSNSYVVHDLDELLYVKDLFDKLVLSWSVLFRKRWRIKSKLVELYTISKKTD